MARIHFFEIADLPWCPQFIRDGITDTLQFLAEAGDGFAPMVPLLAEALNRTGCTEILDLGSGAGGGWLSLVKQFREQADLELHVRLSDLYPNHRAFARLARESDGRIQGLETPLDATKVAPEQKGFRTMFNGFHHLQPTQARALLADAVAQKRGVAVVDGDPNRLLGMVFMLVFMPLMFLVIPFVKPFSWKRLFFTYILPLLPLAIFFDGIVSVLRVYSPRELNALVKTVPGRQDYAWRVGVAPIPKSPLGLSYLIGTPK
ncbi:hypothetical protein [Acanthopleuribacter pedis]|uniref:Class I SAM-dependent methyltransferase n=1 Tax=Acanthopleuribacter pedis TaxID=442870 RepID=A0A8J7Q455_9BACT|nr:hypothetical protein [Acanthopleuribacter pedis]MBO1317356.1 hypothetical protein [Acanthopleuribacter pedis]MBO1318663.1 hypothetical protein [Acanthopleuribacter pedis]